MSISIRLFRAFGASKSAKGFHPNAYEISPSDWLNPTKLVMIKTYSDPAPKARKNHLNVSISNQPSAISSESDAEKHRAANSPEALPQDTSEWIAARLCVSLMI